MSLSRGVLTRAPVAAGILSGVETTRLLLVHPHWDSKSSSKTGKLDQGAELSQDLALCCDSERATEGRRHRMRELSFCSLRGQNQAENMGWLLNSCRHTGQPAQGLQTDMCS